MFRQGFQTKGLKTVIMYWRRGQMYNVGQDFFQL